jgi:hypothetical protein
MKEDDENTVHIEAGLEPHICVTTPVAFESSSQNSRAPDISLGRDSAAGVL